MIRENKDIRDLLGLSEQTLKKIRSLMVNEFGLLTRGQKIDDYEFKLIQFAVEYVNDNPGASYATGIEKALQKEKRTSIESQLDEEDLEGYKNYQAMNERYKGMWDSYIMMTESLVSLAKEQKQDDIAKLLQVTMDLTANTLGRGLRNI